MEIAKVSVSGVAATTVEATTIPAGIIGATIAVEYGPEWGGMIKNVSFRGAEDVTVVNVGNVVKLPQEVAAKPNMYIQIGFTGVSGDGTVLIPTLWAYLGTTKPASPVNVEGGSTPPVWAQVVAMIGDLRNLNTVDKSNLVAAVNEVMSNSGGGNGAGAGGYYTPVVTQPTANTMMVSFVPSVATMPAVEPVTITLPGSDSGQNPTVEPAEDDIPDVHFIVKGGMPFTKDEGDVQVLMRYISKTATIERYCTAKVQGSSSASNAAYKKRNWTIKVYKDSTYEKKEKLSFKGWPAMNKFVLKAGWVIPGHLRNVGAAKIWGQIMRSRSDYASLPEELRNSPNQGATDGFHVRVFVNGMYWGVYDWIVAKDLLFGQDKDNAAHSILNSELNNQPTCAFSTTTPTINGNWSEELLDSMTEGTKTSMENWIKFVAGSTDEEFVANAENYFDVQSVIDAICFDRIIMTVDNMCRNQIVFKYDTKWYMGKWDLDAILGLPPVAGQTWYSYDTAYQEGYVAYKDYGIINMLYERTEKLFLERFKENYWRLRSGPLSEANLVEVFGRLSDRLRSIEGLLAEENASTTGNGQFTAMPNVGKDTIQQIREIVVKRCTFMDEEVENMSGESGGEEEPDEPVVPEVTLTSISATYSGGEVTEGTALTDLTGIVVKAAYSDGSTKEVTGYTLSGEISVGTNTITVSYGGKTTTFTVVGVAKEPEKTMTGIAASYYGGDVAVGTNVTSLIGVDVDAVYSDGSTEKATGYTLSGTIAEGENTITVSYNGFTATFTVTGIVLPDGVVSSFADSTWETGYWDPSANGEMATILQMHHSQLIPLNVNPGGKIRIIGVSHSTNANNTYVRVNYFDADFNWIGYDAGSGINVDGFSMPVQVMQVENAAYYGISANTADKSKIVVTDSESYYDDPDGLLLDGISWHYGSINGVTGAPITGTTDIISDAFVISDYVGAPIILTAETIEEQYKQSTKIVFFDSDGAFLSSLYGGFSTKGVVPEGAVTAKAGMWSTSTEYKLYIGVNTSAYVLLGKSTVTEILS